MHTTNLAAWQHGHDFCGEFSGAERKTRRVLILTAVMMVIEIIAGLKLRSMALFADGCHMATHVAAFLITVTAYGLARRHAANVAYSFGTGKIAVLGAFTSAIILGGIAFFMAGESILRLFQPAQIQFNEAIAVACVGLAVNLASAFILKDDHHHHLPGENHHHHHHEHEHPHDHGHDHHHHHDRDLNLKAAYIHVLADALTSILAIGALTGGKMLGWYWLDPMMGLVGGAIIAQWAWSLIRDTHGILLDEVPADCDLCDEIHKAVETDEDTRIVDLHIWQVAVNKFAAIISVVAHEPRTPQAYKELLRQHEELVHVTVEVNRCAADESVPKLA